MGLDVVRCRWRRSVFSWISHLVISLWGTLLIVLGLRRILGVPVGLAVLLSVLAISVSLPVAIMFMRSPF